MAVDDLTTSKDDISHRLPSKIKSQLPPETFRVMWSSGSTGLSKPIVWRQDTLAAERLRWNTHVGFTHEDVFLCLHTLDVAHATDLHLFSSVAAGAHLILLPESGDSNQFVDLVDKYSVTALGALPTHYREIINRTREGDSTPQRLATIRCAMSGGSMTTDQLLSDTYSVLGLELREIYGSTEFGLAMISPPAAGGQRQDLFPVSGVGVSLRDNKNPGELELDPILTADEYWRREADSHYTFGPGVFRAGDLALQSNSGGYQILGRASDYFINSEGNPINLFSIDEYLRKRYSTTEVLSIQEKITGTDQFSVMTYIGANAPDEATVKKILLTEGLPEESIVKRIARIPRTPVGKYDKGALIALRRFEAPYGPLRFEYGAPSDQNRVVVMIPGLGFGAGIFRQLAKELSNATDVYVLDLPGHGKYTQLNDYTLSNYVATVLDFLRTVKSDDITLLGWSLGATAVWKIIHENTISDIDLPISRAVIIEQSPRLTLEINWPHGAFGQLTSDLVIDISNTIKNDFPRFINNLAVRSSAPFEKEVLDSKEYEIGMVCQKALQILWEEAAQVDQRKAIISDNIPTLLLFGEASQVYPTDIGNWLHSHLSRSSYIKLRGMGHIPFLEDPRHSADQILKFISD